MDKLPPEVHHLIIGYITQDLHNVKSLEVWSDKNLHVNLASIINLALTSRYYHAIALPIVKQELERLLKIIHKAPWQYPADSSSKAEQKRQLLLYIDSVSNVKKSALQKWIVKETAPKTPFNIRLTDNWDLDGVWQSIGATCLNRGWIKGIKTGRRKYDRRYKSRYHAGLLCFIKSLNPRLIMLDYNQTTEEAVIRTAKSVTKRVEQKEQKGVVKSKAQR